MSAQNTTTGAMFKKFYADPIIWGEPAKDNWYVDDLFVVVNGLDQPMDAVYARYGDNFEHLPDDATVFLDSGYLCWQGKGPEPRQIDDNLITGTFARWEKKQTTMTVVATLDLDKAAEAEQNKRVISVLAALGAKVNLPPELSGPDQVVDVNEHAHIAKVIADLIQGPSPTLRRRHSPG